MLVNYNIKIYNGELEILKAGEYWYNKSTRELKEGDGISAYNELTVLGKIEDCIRELIPENFGVKSYITEAEALENADLDSEINIYLLNEIIEIATISCLPINFNKRYYCINNSIIINPQNLSSPQATSENVIMNGNGATLIIGTNMPAILIKSCANTISDFNLTFNKNIFDSINGRMYFENQKYFKLEKNYYTNSLFKIESGYAKTLAQSNRVINVDAYNPNFWGCGASDSTYYF